MRDRLNSVTEESKSKIVINNLTENSWEELLSGIWVMTRVIIEIPFRKNSMEQFLLFQGKKCSFCGILCVSE